MCRPCPGAGTPWSVCVGRWGLLSSSTGPALKDLCGVPALHLDLDLFGISPCVSIFEVLLELPQPTCQPASCHHLFLAFCAPATLVFVFPVSFSFLFKSFSNQDSLVLAQKQKYRSMEQDRKPRDKPTHIWSTYL